MRSRFFPREKKTKMLVFFWNGANMAASNNDFGSLALEGAETVLAIRLAEALRSDEVEIFLEIYDSIPSSTEIKRVDEIKEMARQLAALPKKQFEMYRSKKILSNDHSFIWPSGSQVIKDKLDTSFISRSFISNVEKDFNVLQNQVEILDSVDQTSNGTQPKTAANKKKRSKSKKGKPANAVADETGKPADINCVSNGTGEPSIDDVENGTGILGSSSVSNGTGIPGNSIVDAKYKVKSLGLESCVPLCVSMNTNLVADISIGRESETGQDSSSTKADLSCGSTSSNDSGIVTPKELFLSEDIKEVDSGLGSYASPVFAKEPPFGFPPSSQKLLESALGLLPSVTFDKDSSSNLVKTSQHSENFIQRSEDSKGDLVLQKETQDIEEDPISDVSDTIKEVSKDFVVIEGDSVDGDVSSSSAVEDEGGWQSQTKRSHRRKKKELVARANKEKNHNDRFQRKDFHKQQSDNQFRKSHHCRKSVDDKKNYSKTTERVLQDKENTNSNAVVDSSAVNSTLGGQTEAKHKNESGLKAGKGLELPSHDKNDSQKEMLPTQKVLSYRDALLKARSKAEPAESSDSGVDANSVSSCELSSLQSETQKDSFNNLQCVDYLRNAWKKVMSDAKQGLVINFSVDSDPVLREQKRKKLTSSKHGAPSELKLKNF